LAEPERQPGSLISSHGVYAQALLVARNSKNAANPILLYGRRFELVSTFNLPTDTPGQTLESLQLTDQLASASSASAIHPMRRVAELAFWR
jgi:hypothetical protein